MLFTNIKPMKNKYIIPALLESNSNRDTDIASENVTVKKLGVVVNSFINTSERSRDQRTQSQKDLQSLTDHLIKSEAL